MLRSIERNVYRAAFGDSKMRLPWRQMRGRNAKKVDRIDTATLVIESIQAGSPEHKISN